MTSLFSPHMETAFGFCTVPPCVVIALCLACYVGFRRSLARARAEVGFLAEDLRILIEKGQVDRARSRLLAARGPLAGALSGLGLTWGEVRERSDDGIEQAAGAAVSGIGRGWKLAARFVAGSGMLGTIACLALMIPGLPWWEVVLLSAYALLCLFGVQIVGRATCKLMEQELEWLKELVLQALPSIHGLTKSARASPSA